MPSLQYDVGTDYFNYISIYDGEVSHELFYRKGEYVFYYIYKLLIEQNLGSQSIFVVVSIIQAILFYFILYRLKVNGVNIYIFGLLFLLIPGIYQNQMNGLRTYTAALIFVLSFILKSQNKTGMAYCLAFVGPFVHSTFIPMVLALLLPNRVWTYFGNHLLISYFLSFMFWMSPLPIELIEQLIQYILPTYSHYIDVIHKPISYLNFVTKAYWIPLQILFLVFCMKLNLPAYMRILLGFWALTAPLFLSLLSSGLLFRLSHYCVIFNILPVYYLVQKYSKSSFILGIILLYSTLPFVLKVFIFAVGEYDYQSILF